MKGLLLALWKKLNFSKHFQLKIIRMFQDQFLVGVTGLIFNEKNEVLVFDIPIGRRPGACPEAI